jgi:hypothetical protein
MTELKTKASSTNVKEFLNSIPDENKKKDGFALLKILEEITGEKAKMWGTSIVGFGQYHYKSQKSSQEGDWMLTGFSPRKSSLTLYIISGFEGTEELLAKLGKHKTSVGCLYINKLSDVDEEVLKEIIKKSYSHMKKIHS